MIMSRSHSVENQEKLLSQQDLLSQQQQEVNKQSGEILTRVKNTQTDMTTFFVCSKYFYLPPIWSMGTKLFSFLEQYHDSLFWSQE